MNPEYNIQDLVDRYLTDKMSEAEKLAFEAQLAADDMLATALKAQKVVDKIIIGEELLKLKAQMSSDFESGNYAKGVKPKTWRNIFIATGIVITAAILYFLLENDRNERSSNKIIENQTIVSNPVESHQPFIDQPSRSVKKNVNDTITNDRNIPSIENQKKEVEQNKKANNNCSDPIINFSCQALGTCIEKKDGSIEIDLTTIKSANAPFSFSVNPKESFQKEPIISDLKAGSYTLYVKDSKQCLHELEVKVEVPVVDCKEKK